jgi:hypothetical protein
MTRRSLTPFQRGSLALHARTFRRKGFTAIPLGKGGILGLRVIGRGCFLTFVPTREGNLSFRLPVSKLLQGR